MTPLAGCSLPGEGLTLALDASTYAGSVALVRGSEVLAERSVAMRDATSERLMPAVASALDEIGATAAALGRIVCGAGPGSFTSLRIAAAIAKGIAAGQGCPLYALSSLLLLVAGQPASVASGTYLALLDAMRGDVYSAVLEVEKGGWIREVVPSALISGGDVAELAATHHARTIGPGREIDVAPHARGVSRLASRLAASAPVALDSWEPDYGRMAEAQVRWQAAQQTPRSHSR